MTEKIRNSLKYVSCKDRKRVAGDLKPVYTAPEEESALFALEDFEEKWGQKYPQIGKSWHANWKNLAIFLGYPKQIRKVIYNNKP